MTGCLAVDAMAADDAIDLFIVVRPRRLWTARFLISRVVRSASAQGITIQPVYIATTRAPELPQHSVSIAWDLAQLAVVVGEDISRTVRRSNDWMFDLLPNATIDGNLDHRVNNTPSGRQKRTESLLLLPPFHLFERWIRRRQVAQLRKATRRSTIIADDSAGHRDRFSAEVCDEHLGARAALSEQTWTARMNRD